MMRYIVEAVNALTEIDTTTIALLGFICALAKLMIKNHLVNSAMVFVMFPFTLLFSMSTYAIFNKLELFAPNKPDQWLMYVIVSATIGVLVMLCVTLLLMNLTDALKNRAYNDVQNQAPHT
jgi:ABC-type Na+ efflux pump permease subunit